MEKDNMLQDPTEKNQPSVFRFDAYPGESSIYPWDASSQDTKCFNSCTRLQSSPKFSSLTTSQQIPKLIDPQVSASSFGFTKPTLLGSQFTFQETSNYGSTGQRAGIILGKRKTDSPPLQQCKQHITEEKMAEHMSRLHISSETATSLLEPVSVINKRLYMCEEMRKLQTEPLLPAALVAQIQRPCTALVLWQPPSRVSSDTSNLSNNSITKKEDSNKDKDESLTNDILESLDMDNEFGGTMDLDS